MEFSSKKHAIAVEQVLAKVIRTVQYGLGYIDSLRGLGVNVPDSYKEDLKRVGRFAQNKIEVNQKLNDPREKESKT